jgi:transposase
LARIEIDSISIFMQLRMPTKEEIYLAYDEGKEAIVALFDQVARQVEILAIQLEKHSDLLKELEGRLSKNSGNSSKPPSSDGYNKPNRTESLRKSGKKLNGGQTGHKGNTLKAVENPDRIKVHTVDRCEICNYYLNEMKGSVYEERQVFDIPSLRIEVTGHRAEVKICPKCGVKNIGKFPSEVSQPVQYGSGVKTWASYFTNQHFISLDRTTQIFEDLLGHRISEGMVLKASEELYDQIFSSIEAVKGYLRRAKVLHLDESGLRVKGKLHWLHVSSNLSAAHYEVHKKRGKEAMDDCGILKDFTGIAIHDHWKPYFRYEVCSHGLCNALI